VVASRAGAGFAAPLQVSVFCGRPGERLVGFDNERGKGDHKHLLDRESAYRFTTLEKPLDDFAASVAQVTGRSP
jgi:hypothetical protein